MKKIFAILTFTLFLHFLHSNAFGQNPSVNITCSVGSPSCFFVNPGTFVSYVAQINDAGLTDVNGWSKFYLWSVEPTSGALDGGISGATTQTPSMIWANKTNSPVRKIKVKVDWKKPGQSTVTRIDEQIVTIKHIAPITSMFITGGVTANPSNGATVSVPCGVLNLTVTVPTPVTNPTSPVTYTWTKPSGWGGSSTTNIINLTTNPGANDGQLRVTAQRSDGTVTQTYTVNIDRPQVSSAIITHINWNPGHKALCTGESRQLSGTSSPNATTFAWTKSGGTNIVSGAGSPTVTINGTTDGNLTLTASNSCGVSKFTTIKIFAGPPQLSNSDIIVDGHPNYFPQPNITTGSSYITFQNESACQSYKWQLFGGSGYFTPNGNCSFCLNNFNGINFDDCGHGSASTSSNMALKILSANRCGQGVDRYIVLEVQGGGYYSMASPNPAIDEIAIDFEVESAKSSLLSISLVNNMNSQVVRNMDFSREQQRVAYFEGSPRVTFQVGDLLPGAYYLAIRFGGLTDRVFKELIIIEK